MKPNIRHLHLKKAKAIFQVQGNGRQILLRPNNNKLKQTEPQNDGIDHTYRPQHFILPWAPQPLFPNKVYLSSALMFFGGAFGFALLLKYQKSIENHLPHFLKLKPGPSSYLSNNPQIQISKHSLYYYLQSVYLQFLAGWSIIFLKKSRSISCVYYMMLAGVFATLTYVTDYKKQTRMKHVFWFLFNCMYGAILGSYFYQYGFVILLDVIYIIANSIALFAAANYYNKGDQFKGMLATGFLCSIFGTMYGVSVLQLFGFGFRLQRPLLYGITFPLTWLMMGWSIYRSRQISIDKNEYQHLKDPIEGGLSYMWKMLPQLIAMESIYRKNSEQQINE